jgi:hypothetical protein
MLTKEIEKKEAGSSDFIIFQTEIADIQEAMIMNIGSEGVTAGDFERIRVPSGTSTSWSIPGLDGEELVKQISGIIVAWRDTRSYWRVPLEESSGNVPPDCHSLDGRIGIGTPGGNCQNCDLARYGSNPKSDAQACKAVKELFLVRENAVLPVIVHLPPSSLKPARQYFVRLASKPIPCFSIITNIRLETARNGQGIAFPRAVFTAGDQLSPEQAQRAREYASMIDPFLTAAPAIPVQDMVQAAEGHVV